MNKIILALIYGALVLKVQPVVYTYSLVGPIATAVFSYMYFHYDRLMSMGWLIIATTLSLGILSLVNLGGLFGTTLLNMGVALTASAPLTSTVLALGIYLAVKRGMEDIRKLNKTQEEFDGYVAEDKKAYEEKRAAELAQIKKDREGYDNFVPDPVLMKKITARILREKAEEEAELAKKKASFQPDYSWAEGPYKSPKRKTFTPRRYTLPSLEILNSSSNSAVDTDNDFLKRQGEVIIKSLSIFKVTATLVDYIVGPTVTTYRILPEIGTKYSLISSRKLELMGALASRSIRIVTPITGTSYIGIEVPNKKRITLGLKEMMKNFKSSSSLTTIALGKSNSGEYIYGDMHKMPHMLVAGTTGSGKSVALQGMITSLLMRNTPETLQLALIDPKQAEFSAYEGLPHLYSPVVYTDTNKARDLILSLVNEMENRNSMIRKAGVKNIVDYNKKAVKKLPFIVLFIEEYADLNMADAEVSAEGPSIAHSLTRIAQKARSAGIHAVVATQRPSADAVPSMVRSNLPSFVACKVRGEADSKIIMQETGAESLLGNGDMLYKPMTASAPERLQGAFVSDEEIEAIVNHYKRGNHH